jgi:hypothetical protein
MTCISENAVSEREPGVALMPPGLELPSDL